MASDRAWRQAAGHAAALAALILAPMAYWFGAANRHVVFLYAHMGAEPFDTITASRYWMAGLVAGGGALVLYTGFCWLAGRLAARKGRRWAPPPWQRVWLCAAPPVGVAVVAITMTLGAPTLPLGLALACAATTVAGLAGASIPGALAAARPASLAWLAANALALAPPLLLLRALAPEMRSLLGVGAASAAAGLSLLFALAWLAAMSLLSRWRRRRPPSAANLTVAALIQAYLLLPALHYLFSDLGGPYYISTAGNFFPHSALLQGGIVLAVGAMAWAVTAVRRRIGA